MAPDAAELARRAARLVADTGRATLARTGRFCLALSGGRTPSAMFGHLAAEDLAWERVHVFQVDERVAPDGDPGRNLTALQRELLDLVPARRHLMDVTAADPAAAATAYGDELRAVCEGVLDLVHLGLGDDGHTASWPPGDPVVDAEADVGVAGPYAGYRRLTLTPRAVNRAASIFFLVSGADKGGALAALCRGEPGHPRLAGAARRAGPRRPGSRLVSLSRTAPRTPSPIGRAAAHP